jgi:hypothetical protein
MAERTEPGRADQASMRRARSASGWLSGKSAPDFAWPLRRICGKPLWALDVVGNGSNPVAPTFAFRIARHRQRLLPAHLVERNFIRA